MIGNPHLKWVESYNIHQSFAEAKYYRVLSLQTVHKLQRKENKVFNEVRTTDNDKLMIRTTSCPWRDPPKSAHCGGEFGTKAQYPSPQTEPAARVKTTNPEYKEYSARLNRVRLENLDSKGMQDYKGGLQALLSN